MLAVSREMFVSGGPPLRFDQLPQRLALGGHVAGDVDHVRFRVRGPDHLGPKLDVHRLHVRRSEGGFVELRGPQALQPIHEVRVCGLQTFGRDELHERVADDILSTVTEELLPCSVHIEDFRLRIEDEDAVRGVGNQLPIFRLGTGECLSAGLPGGRRAVHDPAVPDEGDDACRQGCLDGEGQEPTHDAERGRLRPDRDREHAE